MSPFSEEFKLLLAAMEAPAEGWSAAAGEGGGEGSDGETGAGSAERNRARARRSRERKKVHEARKTAWMRGVERENERLVRRTSALTERVQVLVGVARRRGVETGEEIWQREGVAGTRAWRSTVHYLRPL